MKVERVEGPAQVVELGIAPAVHTTSTAMSSVFASEAGLIELKQQLSLDSQRETLTSNVSAAYHRSAMAVIGNMKA